MLPLSSSSSPSSCRGRELAADPESILPHLEILTALRLMLLASCWCWSSQYFVGADDLFLQARACQAKSCLRRRCSASSLPGQLYSCDQWKRLKWCWIFTSDSYWPLCTRLERRAAGQSWIWSEHFWDSGFFILIFDPESLILDHVIIYIYIWRVCFLLYLSFSWSFRWPRCWASLAERRMQRRCWWL